MKRILLFLIVCACTSFYGKEVISQVTIWSEDFSTNSDGDVTGDDNQAPTGADWTSGGCTTCPSSSGDYWEIRSNRMEAQDVNDEIVNVQTEVIDISGTSTVQFSVLVTESGDHEGLYLGTDDCGEVANADFADVSYRIDGGAWTLVPNALGWCGLYASCATHTLYGDDGLAQGDCRNSDVDWISATVSVTGLSGSTSLEILLEARNSSASEQIQFDNILVEGFFPLPIELLSFTGRYNGTYAELEWETASETDNNYFELQRSLDGHNFEAIATVDGAGTSNRLQHYEYGDIQFSNLTEDATIYYRLKQVDFNADFSYSDIVPIRIQQQSFDEILLYPNPATNAVNLEVFMDRAEPLELKIYNTMGQLMQATKQQAVKGVNTIQLPLESLSKGMYVASLSNGYKTISQYFTKD
jgi:hypothetical protein